MPLLTREDYSTLHALYLLSNNSDIQQLPTRCR